MPDDHAELALSFALAIVRPGGNALVIDEDNRPDEQRRWVPLEEAAASGVAFAVEPCDNVVAIDVDDDADRAWAGLVRDGLEPLGCSFVGVESGREGHEHLWVLAPPGWDQGFIKAEAERVAGPPPDRRQIRSNAIRPPYAPHRHGGRSRVVDPGPGTALRLFREHRSQGVPSSSRKVLRWLDPQLAVRTVSGKVDRGRSINRAAVGMANARCTFREFLEELEARPNEVTSKYLALPSAGRTKFAIAAWQDALKFVRENPPTDATRSTVLALREAIGTHEWPARTIGTDLPVYEALLHIADKAAKLTVDASIRELSELAGVGTGAVSAALKRLDDRGLVSPVHDRRSRHLAKAYRLHEVSESYVLPHTSVLLGGPRAICVDLRTFLEDVFSNGGGLGRATRLTWEALTEAPSTKSEIAARRLTKVSDRALGDHLRKLHGYGFADKAGRKWSSRTPTERERDLLLDHLGVRGRSQRRRDRHHQERQQYQAAFGVSYNLPPEPDEDGRA